MNIYHLLISLVIFYCGFKCGFLKGMETAIKRFIEWKMFIKEVSSLDQESRDFLLKMKNEEK